MFLAYNTFDTENVVQLGFDMNRFLENVLSGDPIKYTCYGAHFKISKVGLYATLISTLIYIYVILCFI